MRRTTRPEHIWPLALLYAGGSLGSLAGAAFPMSEHAPVRLDLILGVVAAVVATLVWVFGRSLHRWGLHVLLLGGTAATSSIVASSATLGGATTAGFIYVCIVMCAAHFTGRRAALAHAGAVSAAFGIGLLVAGLPRPATSWVVATVVVLAVAVVVTGLVNRLEQLAYVDPLTGALKRAGLTMVASKVFRNAQRSG